MKKIMTCVIIVALLFALGLTAAPADGQPLSKTAAATAGQVTRTLSNISNWSYWVYYNGQTGHAPDGSSGGVYPRGTAGAIYQDGFVWGGRVNGSTTDIRVGGQTYNIGTVPGWVITGGDYGSHVIASSADPRVRVYRIRQDYESLTHAQLVQDAAEQNMVDASSVTTAMTQEIIDQYALDWEEWPVDLGAPYYDIDTDGAWTDGVDIPGIAQADQVVWYVCNDYNQSATTGLYGSNPIGLELQTTLWAYNQPGVRLGQIVFRSNKLINKSNYTMTDMYVSMWADPDLGSASNDFCGCDTVLSLGYAYNGEATDSDYDAFDLAPPAFGYDFFQGPVVAGAANDTAIFELDYLPGYKNLPMTSFGWFSAGSPISDPDLGEYSGTLQFYNLMRGYVPTDDVINPTPWYEGNNSANAETKFPLWGDPVAGTGDLDGAAGGYFPPGDRRICLSSGPFDFAPGDVQEVVVAILGGLGANAIGSVADLKTTDAVAQQLFDGLFREVPKPPVSPNVTARPFEQSIVLEWGSDVARVAQIEETEVSGYVFEGYNVYQLPHGTATKDQAVRIATYDLDNGIKLIYENRTPAAYEGEEVSVPIIYGNDGGVQRYIIIEWDYINNKPLYEGSTYYFAVTAYNQNHDEGRLAEKAMESSVVPMAVTLQEPLPGVGLNAAVQSQIPVEHTAGASGGQLAVTVVDPFAITGHDYKVTFTYNEDSTEVLFNVIDVTDGNTLLSSGNAQVSDLSEKAGAPVVDGLEIKVAGPPSGIKHVIQLDAPNGNMVDNNLFLNLNYTGDGSQPWHRAGGALPFYLDNPLHALNGAWAAAVFDRFQSFGTSDIEIVFGDSSVAWSYLNDVVLTEKVPFAVYKYDLDGTIRRLFPAIYDGMVTGTDGTWDYGTGEGYFGGEAFERIYAYDNSADGYKVADEAAYIAANDIYAAPSSTGWGSPDNPYVYPQLNNLIIAMYVDPPAAPPANGTVIRFNTHKPNDITDVFEFSTAGLDPTSSDSLLALAIEKINVFPNPYYAYNELSTSPYNQYVTFTHLPAKATIKIYNLAGVLVRTISHDNAAAQFAQWDLMNASNIPVASGMYIAHIDMPDVGEQKILKFMIIQSKQILEYY